MENKVLVNKSDLTAVGDAVRSQTGESNLLTLGEMESRIRTLSSGGGSRLPTVSTEDNHKILQVVDGEWQKVEPLCYSEVANYAEVLQTTSFELVDGAITNGDSDTISLTLLREIKNNVIYTVMFDNEPYQTTALQIEGMFMLGNGGILGMQDTGEPFVLMLMSGELICDAAVLAQVEDGTHTISIIEGIAPAVIINSPMGYFTYDENVNAYICNVSIETSMGEFYADKTYIVDVDNKSYTIQTKNIANLVVGGNLSLLGLSENTGEEIALLYAYAEGMYQYILATVDEGEFHQVKISELGETIKTIDPKYLPKDDILAMIDAYMKEALGGVY